MSRGEWVLFFNGQGPSRAAIVRYVFWKKAMNVLGYCQRWVNRWQAHAVFAFSDACGPVNKWLYAGERMR